MFFFLVIRLPPSSTLFPYTTLFRSVLGMTARRVAHDLGEEVGERVLADLADAPRREQDRKSTRLNSSHTVISYAVFCLKKKIYEGKRKSRLTNVAPILT